TIHIQQGPRITTERVPGTAVVTHMKWTTAPMAQEVKPLKFVPGDVSSLELDVRITQPEAVKEAPVTAVDGILKDFSLAFQDVVTLGFDQFHFNSTTGQKTIV